MVLTMLEAHVKPDRVADLQAAYKAGTKELLPGMVRAYLVHSISDPGLWRMMAIWDSQEWVEQMRNSGEPPPGVQMFRAVGAEPMLSMYEVVAERSI